MMQYIIDFWNQFGWLANLLQIISALFAVFLFFKYVIIRAFKRHEIKKFKSVTSYIKNKLGHNDDVLQEIIKNSNVAIIDDDLDDFPIDYLKKIGIDPDTYESVSLSEINKFLKYDVLLLDITGVVEEDMQNGGLEFMRRLKAKESSPAVIAVSSKTFDPTKTEFFRLADDTMDKPISETECEESIINILRETKSPCTAAEKIDSLLYASEISHDDQEKFRNILIRHLEGDVSDLKFNKKISKYFWQIDRSDLMRNVEIILHTMEVIDAK